MGDFFQYISQFLSHLKVWIVIAPWDVGVRVRLGKNATRLQPGFHFRIPLVDEITLVNTRLRIIAVPPVNASQDGKTCRIVRANVGCRVLDPLQAMMDCGSFEAVIAARTQDIIADGFLDADDCRKRLAASFAENVISIEYVSFVENITARAFRLVDDGWCLRDKDEPSKRY